MWKLIFALPLAALAQTPGCVPMTARQLIIYRAGSLTDAFVPLEKTFTCQTGIHVKDVAMGSVDAVRQITAGGQACDLYAPADYLDIDLFLKPAGYANFNIVFARGKMVLAYSASGIERKKLPPIAEPGSRRAAAKWFEILAVPGVWIGSGHPFLDPAAYRAPMIFQLTQAYYSVPNLYNNLLEHVVIAGSDPSAPTLGKGLDFQFTYEHTARALANSNPDYRYVELPDEIDLSNPAKDAYYRQNAVVAIPGLGVRGSARTIAVPGTHVAWGITVLKNAPNKENAVRFLQLLLGPSGTAALNNSGPTPVSPAVVNSRDFRELPAALRAIVAVQNK